MKNATNWRTLSEHIMKFLMQSPEGLPPDYARFHVVARIVFPIGTAAHVCLLLMFWYLDLEILAIFNILSVIVFAYSTVQTYRGSVRLPVLLTLLIEVTIHAVLATIYTGLATGFWLYFFLAIVIVLIWPFHNRRVRLSLSVGLTLVLTILVDFIVGVEPIHPTTNEWIIFFFDFNVLAFAATLIAIFSSYEFSVVRAEDALQVEFDRAEKLLLNILPIKIASRLKSNEEPLADSHECVSVLFADLAGFTDLSRNLTANELVSLLNDLFSRFDDLVNKHGAEKVKTIGDAYMAATGLTGDNSNHAEKIADLALDMKEAFGEFRAKYDVNLQLRIGVHSGAVIAGVIGKQKFAYDLWGDTVNIASRMESGGLPDQIQISAQTKELLHGKYRTTPRGEIKIKGHVARATFLLEGRT